MIRNTLAVALMLAGATAFAQPTTGQVTITGNTAAAVSMKIETAIDTANLTTVGASATNNGGLNDALNATINFGNIASGDTGQVQAVTLRLALRSNVAYVLSAEANGGGVLPASEIGFAITGVDATGNNVVSPRTDTIQGTFSRAPLTNVTPAADGTAAVLTSLASLTTGPVSLLSGDRISARGSFLTPTNALYVDNEIALLPQLFSFDPAASTFTYVVDYTIATP